VSRQPTDQALTIEHFPVKPEQASWVERGRGILSGMKRSGMQSKNASAQLYLKVSVNKPRRVMEAPRHPRYKLLATDLDGTLMGDGFTLSSRVKTVIRRAIDRGVHVTLATGRGYAATLQYARELGITTPLICYQGGQIRDPGSGEVLHNVTMPRALAKEAIRLARERGWHLCLYVDDQAFLSELLHPPEFYERWVSMTVHCVPDLTVALDGEPTKFIIIADEPQADRIEKELRAHMDGHLKVVRSHRFFVEGNPLQATKGQALAHLAGLLGVARSEVMAIGDQGNDADMVAWAGLGVAMGNAVPQVKAVSDHVAPSVDEDGAAVAIERFLLSEE
jgi:Cof subfamily protein (haloacid dehalogenase superfamily)